MKRQKNSDAIVQAVIDGSAPWQNWGAWETACLTEFALENKEHPINNRLEISPIAGKVYLEKFTGGRANPANYTYPTVGSTVLLDGKKLP